MPDNKPKPNSAKLMIIKLSRGLTYFAYGYAIVASVFLALGTFLLLFSANTESGFVRFVYSGAVNFLEPFKGIFPPKQVSETGYFSTSAVFAIIMYLIAAVALHSLISWLTLKMYEHESKLEKAMAEDPNRPRKSNLS